MKTKTATPDILKAFLHRESITSIDAFHRWGITRLASVVHNLRKAGYEIRTEITTNGRKRYARYYLG